MKPLRLYRFALALIAALLAIVALRLPLAPRSTDYASSYRPVARSLVEGEGLVYTNGTPAVRYPPGHPIVLAATWWIADLAGADRERAADCLGAVSHVVSTLLVFELALAAAGRKTGAFAALMWAGYPPALAIPGTGNSEITYIPLVLLGFVLAARRTPSIGSNVFLGLICGAVILIRPAGVALPMALLLYLATRREHTSAGSVGGLGVLVLATTLTLAPWWGWTTLRTGSPILLSTGGLPSMVDGWTFARHDRGVRVSPREEVLTAELRQMWVDGEITSSRDLLTALSHADPAAVFHMLGRKMVRSWYATDSQRHELALALMQGCLLTFAMLGAVRLFRRDQPAARHLAVLCGSWVLLSWASTVLVLSILRYMVPAMPVVVILAAIALVGTDSPAGTSHPAADPT